MDASGNFIWVKTFGGLAFDDAWSVCADATGNVYTTGFFSGTADFNPGPGTYNLTAQSQDIFVQKMDASGNFLWAKSFEGTSVGMVYSNKLDNLGNIYTLGYFMDTVDFDPGPGNYSLISEGGFDIFIQKMDSSGDFLWAKSFGDTSDDYGRSICTDASGNLYTIGAFGGTVDFDPGVGTTYLTADGYDIFVQKLSSSSNAGLTGNDFGNKLTIFPNPTDGNLSIDLGSPYAFIKVTMNDLNGKLIQSKTYDEGQILNLKLEEPSGVYLLTIESGGKKAVIRIVKE